MQNIEKKLGYAFKNRNLLRQALTHSSVTSDVHSNYERLEFLGDRILGVTVAEMLFQTFPDEAEGSLSPRFTRLVCTQAVAQVMRQLDMAQYITANPQEVAMRDNVLCDVGEALIASIYLDSQDMGVAQNFVRQHWKDLIDKHSQPVKDYKTELQEKAFQVKLPAPVYELVTKVGPEHDPEFLSRVLLGGEYITEGRGKNKKQSEQEAAKEMLAILEKING